MEYVPEGWTVLVANALEVVESGRTFVRHDNLTRGMTDLARNYCL
jgi:hypothetical protein